jgi:hypothetical protein
MVMDFSNMPGPGIEDDGLVDNPCWPKELIDDPGFACTSSRSFFFQEGSSLMLCSAPGRSMVHYR